MEAACRVTKPDALFETGAAQYRAKTMCTGCLVRLECLAHVLDHREWFGVWGGVTERERRALLRRPHVTSWRHLLEKAQAAAEFEAATGARAAVGRNRAKAS